MQFHDMLSRLFLDIHYTSPLPLVRAYRPLRRSQEVPNQVATMCSV